MYVEKPSLCSLHETEENADNMNLNFNLFLSWKAISKKKCLNKLYIDAGKSQG